MQVKEIAGVHLKSAAAKPQPLYPWNLGGADDHTIGVLDPCYGSSHVIYGLETHVYHHRTLKTLPLRRLDRRTTFFEFTPVVLDRQVPLVHSWNAIPLNKDFVVSFELELPRYLHQPSERQVAFALKLLESDRCKRILALSEFARDHAARALARRGHAGLMRKMSVFRGAIADPFGGNPPARPPRPSFAEKPFSAVVIGTQLFRKGGMHAILAFEDLRARGHDVRLTLIGDFEAESYAYGSLIPDREEWRARARSHQWITFTGPIPNAQVFGVLRDHDLCLYPSLDESLGWLPIESQMIEVPVLGNRVCAFGELVAHDRTGWLIDLPLGPEGRWEGIDTTAEHRARAIAHADRAIVAGIVDCVERVHREPGVLAEWGRAGREMALANYGMAQASARLEQIYDEVLGRR